jgi:hypothetical protein
MPKILDRLVTQLEAQGMPPSKAYPIAIKKLQESGNLKPGTIQPTAQGIRRGNMTPAQRAKDRAIKKYKIPHNASEIIYRKSTNSVYLKR